MTIILRGRHVEIELLDHAIQEGDPDEDGIFTPDELVFSYRVLDEEGEITQLSPAEREAIHWAILEDLWQTCS